MSASQDTHSEDVPMEVSKLVETLRRTEERLQQLMENQVDSVLLEAGQTYMLSRAQDELRASEERQRMLANTQMAILNALPAHIALLDPNGVILSVNESWRLFAKANAWVGAQFGIGQNYLAACDLATGDCAEESLRAAAGIRSVLNGAAKEFSLEYPCHTPTVKRWFQLMVNPLTGSLQGGVVVMHINITERKMAEERLLWKTAFFEALVHSSHDGLLVLERDWTKVIQNQRMVDLWNIPQDIADQVDDRPQYEFVKTQVKNPVEFVERRNYLSDHPEEFSRDEIELKDGKCLERHSTPVRGLDGSSFGRIWTFRDITERKQSEKALLQSEERLRQITNLVPHGIFAKDSQGRHIFANPAHAEICGLSIQEMMGKTDLELGPDKAEAEGFRADDLAMLRSDTKRLVREETRTDFSGRKRHLQTIKVPLMLAESAEPGVLGVCIDITERKRGEQALHQSEQLFRSMFMAAGTGIAISDPHGRFLKANAAYCSMLGYTEEELKQRDFASLTHPEDLSLNLQLRDELVSGARDSFCMEKRYIKKDGTTVWTRHSVSAMRSAQGEVTTMIVVAEDCTERKRSDYRFRRLVESNAQGVFFWNVKGEILEANDAFLRLVGYTLQDVQTGHLNWITMTPPEFIEANHRAVKELAAKGTCAMFEKEFIRKDGTRVPILIGAATFEDKPDEGVAFVLDLTERKKFELQFLRAQRMESIGTLAGGIAHDLNNVLAPILMAIELLREMAHDEFGLKMLETLRGSAQRGADLVKQVLSFARGIEGERVIVNTIHIMRDLTKVMRDTFPKSIQIRFTPARDLWTVRGDPTQLHQVLLNLCVNARDAMPSGGTINVSMENVVLDDTYAAMNPGAFPGSFVMIKVEDNGTGIPAAIRERIFEPFFTTKEIGVGTGLGLSTTLAIVKSHGGFINLYSEVGKGTRFKIYLPANTSKAASEEVAVEQTRLPRGNGELILLVDDEEAIRKVAQGTLERFGYRVLLAVNGAEAVAVYAQCRENIAVVLTDMAMPIMDGPALIVALKAINPEILIIGSSGLASNGGVAKALGAGVHLFVPKPYTAETMLTTLQKALSGRRASAGNQEKPPSPPPSNP